MKVVAVSVPTFKLRDEIDPPIKVFVVIELVWMGENPRMEDTVKVLAIADPVDIVSDKMELVVTWFVAKIPV